MIGRLVFGDYYNDGHGQWVEKWISYPDLKCIESAKNSIKQQYGEHFFKDFAESYEEPYISYDICEALEESGYNLDRLFTINGCSLVDWPEIKTFTDIANSNFELHISTVVDMYIHLLNYHGAHITPIGNPFDIIDAEVGYGCFE